MEMKLDCQSTGSKLVKMLMQLRKQCYHRLHVDDAKELFVQIIDCRKRMIVPVYVNADSCCRCLKRENLR